MRMCCCERLRRIVTAPVEKGIVLWTLLKDPFHGNSNSFTIQTPQQKRSWEYASLHFYTVFIWIPLLLRLLNLPTFWNHAHTVKHCLYFRLHIYVISSQSVQRIKHRLYVSYSYAVYIRTWFHYSLDLLIIIVP